MSTPSPRAATVEWAEAIYEDLDFGEVKRWREATSCKAIGYLPFYAPRELIHAGGMLPVGLHGGGDRLEIIRGDAYYQSYICHIPRSTIELLLAGRLDTLAGVLFPSTCDVIRNLSGMWTVLRPDMYVHYIDLPQVADPVTAAMFWSIELETLRRDLGEVAGRTITDEAVRRSLALYNEARSVVRSLYALRRDRPWTVPTEELYVLLRAGEIAPVDAFIDHARQYLAAAEVDTGRPRDNSRVLVVGSFCEQPPLGLIKTIERAGCYIVEDDFLIGNRLVTSEVSLEGDPIRALAKAIATTATRTSCLYEPDPQGKRGLIAERVRASRADGVIFAAPSFCDPALLDRPMLKAGAEAAGIPCIGFKYSENSGQFQQFREQAGTFSDSIKLWGGT